ncbi:MAG: hypothetical protein HY914_10245 [Desulfomonile tiedjei]|nr:hypothetical protein [Desulfomonile tiedjei]
MNATIANPTKIARMVLSFFIINLSFVLVLGWFEKTIIGDWETNYHSFHRLFFVRRISCAGVK